jgi:hypothetical protein
MILFLLRPANGVWPDPPADPARLTSAKLSGFARITARLKGGN